MLSPEDNTRLTRTGPDTPMGNVFRAYWMPALLSRELPEADCPPKRVRLLGEDFVAFRDTRGRVGIVEPVCPHRGANLFFGRVADCGIRCSYHGWKFDHRGNCLEIPTLTPEAEQRIKPKAALRALETRESGDVIWAYMGRGSGAGTAPVRVRRSAARAPVRIEEAAAVQLGPSLRGRPRHGALLVPARRHPGRRESRAA